MREDLKTISMLLTLRNAKEKVDKYDYKTLEKVGTVVSSADLAEIPSFSAYTFSDDEKKLLLSTEIEPIFRRSRLGVFYVYEIASKKVVKVSESKIQEPLFSPDGSQVAYVKDNNQHEWYYLRAILAWLSLIRMSFTAP